MYFTECHFYFYFLKTRVKNSIWTSPHRVGRWRWFSRNRWRWWRRAMIGRQWRDWYGNTREGETTTKLRGGSGGNRGARACVAETEMIVAKEDGAGHGAGWWSWNQRLKGWKVSSWLGLSLKGLRDATDLPSWREAGRKREKRGKVLLGRKWADAESGIRNLTYSKGTVERWKWMEFDNFIKT